MDRTRPTCLQLLVQEMACAFSRALLKAGSSIAASMAMIAITTSSSIRVKRRDFFSAMLGNTHGQSDGLSWQVVGTEASEKLGDRGEAPENKPKIYHEKHEKFKTTYHCFSFFCHFRKMMKSWVEGAGRVSRWPSR